MLKRYFEGFVTALLILALMAMIWGFFGALILDLTWWVFTIAIVVILFTAPAVYTFSVRDRT